MFKILSRYISVGIVNTAIHWIVFFMLNVGIGVKQSMSNVIAFAMAVTFSFVANARYTFRQQATSLRYLAYVTFMGGLALAAGYAGDLSNITPVVTLTLFSSISLVGGFAYSRFIVFRNKV